jgi:7-cyano-7-deazaguanine synthase
MYVLLASGGLDSTLLMARLKENIGLALGIDYNQPHKIELNFAKKAAEFYGLPFEVTHLPKLPLVNDVVFAARNAVLLSLGAAEAQARGFSHVVIGCNFSDAVRFPDCRPDFIRNIGRAIYDAYGVHVAAPLLQTTKAQIRMEVEERGLPPTWTCYSPNEDKPCGVCHACSLK